jgi:polyferredoxin
MSRRVTSGRPRRLLGPTVGAAVALAVLAFIVWAVALWVSWGGSCPQASAANGGLDKGISVWPPAAQCGDGQGGLFWHQALPWAPWLIGALIAAAAAILLFGLLVAIRDLRHPAPAAAPRSLSLLETPMTGGRPTGGGPPPRREDEADDHDSSAMAA